MKNATTLTCGVAALAALVAVTNVLLLLVGSPAGAGMTPVVLAPRGGERHYSSMSLTLHVPTHPTVLAGPLWHCLCNLTAGAPGRTLGLALYTDSSSVSEVASMVETTTCAGGGDVTVGTFDDFHRRFEHEEPLSPPPLLPTIQNLPRDRMAHMVMLSVVPVELSPAFGSFAWRLAAYPGGNLARTWKPSPLRVSTQGLSLAGVSPSRPTFDAMRLGVRCVVVCSNLLCQQRRKIQTEYVCAQERIRFFFLFAYFHVHE